MPPYCRCDMNTGESIAQPNGEIFLNLCSISGGGQSDVIGNTGLMGNMADNLRISGWGALDVKTYKVDRYSGLKDPLLLDSVGDGSP